jgi:hypothetical protein
MMQEVIQKVHVIALVHCPCRATAQLIGKKKCDHPLENCIKYDELAEYLIEKGIGKEITNQEGLDVIKKSEEAGLVHLVDKPNQNQRVRKFIKFRFVISGLRERNVSKDWHREV